jgi:hypothetical protein
METQGYNQDGAGYTTGPVAHEKKGVAEKVKGMLGGGHGGHKTNPAADHQQFGVYGDATPQTGTAESTRVGCLDKIKAKAGVGHGLAPEQTRAAHHNQAYVDPNASPDFNGGTNVNSSAAVHGGWPYPTKPNQSSFGEQPHSTQAGGYGVEQPHMAGGYEPQSTQPGGYGVHDPNQAGGYSNPSSAVGYGHPQPTNPTGVTNAAGGAVLGDHHGNIHEGPRDDGVKKEGVVSKLMDKLHKKPANTTTTTTY